MSTPSSWIKSPQFPSYLVAGATVFLLAYFTLLSPASLEDDFSGVRVVHPKDLLNFLKNESEPVLAKGIPTETTPAYSLRNFDFFTTSENKPQLKFSGKKSNFYQTEELIHARESIVTLPDGTVVTSRESAFDTKKNEVDFYGDVVTTFENGVILRSQYMKVITRPIMNVIIPIEEPVAGEKIDAKNKILFKSFGMTYLNTEPKEVKLSSQVMVTIVNDRTTQIQSDQALLNFSRNNLNFFMDEQRAFDRQFVLAHQQALEMKSRVLDVQLKGSRVETLAALSDVKINDRTFFSTSGKAIFFERNNTIELSDFPQVYQDADTITGEVILYNRNDDTIEVKQSNAIYHK